MRRRTARALLTAAVLLNLTGLWLAIYFGAPGWTALIFGMAGLATWAMLMEE